MDQELTSNLLFECGICIENKSVEHVTFLPCIHFICVRCYDKLIKNECPFCRNIISDIKEEEYDPAENEYDDVEFEILVSEENVRPKKNKKKFKKREKKILKLLNDNKEVFVTIDHNTFRVLSNNLDQQ